MPRPTLFISHDAEADWLSAIAFGCVDDGVDPARWDPISCRSAWLLDRPGGSPIGMRVEEVSTAELIGDDGVPGHLADFADPVGPRFDAPTLGLLDVTAAEVLGAAAARFRGEDTLNRTFFKAALNATTATEELRLWNLCLDAGDPMAHYGLALTKYTLGDTRGALEHLRHYAILSTHGAWTHSWLGRAALAENRVDEAILAFRRAVALGLETGTETDAEEILPTVL